MKNLLRKLFDIREGESARALLMFAYIFLIISCLLMLKPVRNSICLDKFSVKQLPYVVILVAVTAAFISSFYSRFANKMRLDSLIKFSLVFINFNLLGFWLLLYFGYEGGWFVYVFYVWVAIFAVITTSQFWIMANYIFNAREAKRLFGFVGAGAISGGIFGGYLTNYLAPVIGTDHLLIICIAFLAVCLLILQIVWRMRSTDSQVEKNRQQKQIRRQTASNNPLTLLKSSRHLAYLAGIVGVSVIVANLVDYQYNAVVEASITDKDARTAFFGFWLSNLSIISLVIQLFLTRRILGSLGVGPSLFLLPIGILLGAAAILIYPVLWAAILIKVSDGSFKQSINKAGLELLFLPVPSDIKPQAKTFIDIFIDSLATGIGGVMLIVCTSILGFSTGNISLIILALILIWVVLIMRIRKEYVQAFRLAIEKRTIDLEEHSVNLEDASIFASLLKVLEGNNDRQIRYVLHLLENVKNDQFISYFRPLLQHVSPEIRHRVLVMLSQYDKPDLSPEITPLVEDANQEVRTEAIAYLYKHSAASEKIPLLKNYLEHSDYRIRGAALMCIARASEADQEIRQSFHLRTLVESTLKNLQQQSLTTSEKTFVKINLARGIGVAKFPKLYPYLHILLNDESPGVLQQAVISAGHTRAEEFIPVLIPLLDNKQVRKFAREALAEFGEPVIERLVPHLKDVHENKNIRLSIPKVLGLTGEQKAVDVLIQCLDQNDLLIRFQVLISLNRLRKNYPMLKFSELPIESKIFEETHNYMNTLTILYTQNNGIWNEQDNSSERVQSARFLLIKALEEKLDTNLERIFRLLGLKYHLRDMFNAYLGIVSKKQDLRANAVEFLDNVLDPGLKKYIIPIATIKFKKIELNGDFHFSNRNKLVLKFLISPKCLN